MTRTGTSYRGQDKRRYSILCYSNFVTLETNHRVNVNVTNYSLKVCKIILKEPKVIKAKVNIYGNVFKIIFCIKVHFLNVSLIL